MKRKRLIGSIAAACAAAALTAGIAEGSGTTQSSSASATSGPPGAPAGVPGLGGDPGEQAVHSIGVVLDKAKTGFVTQTTDRGTIESVNASAGTIAIVEGTKAITYKTVTVTLPSAATVSLDGKSSTLGALGAGDRVSVSASSDGTVVIATDSSFRPERGPGQGAAKGQVPPGESSASGSSSSSSTAGTGTTTSG